MLCEQEKTVSFPGEQVYTFFFPDLKTNFLITLHIEIYKLFESLAFTANEAMH